MCQKIKFTTSITIIFTHFSARDSRVNTIFRNTAFFKYCMYRQKHAGFIIVVNNIPNLQWKIYPGFFADVSSANPKKCKGLSVIATLTSNIFLTIPGLITFSPFNAMPGKGKGGK